MLKIKIRILTHRFFKEIGTKDIKNKVQTPHSRNGEIVRESSFERHKIALDKFDKILNITREKVLIKNIMKGLPITFGRGLYSQNNQNMIVEIKNKIKP